MSKWLADEEAHLWYVNTGDVGDVDLTAEYRRLMNPEELAAEQRYWTAASQLQHRVARALVRTTLSRYSDVDPRDWVFRRGPYGRPEVAFPQNSRLRFNLSHTAGMVACLVALDRDVGVDVENTARKTLFIELAERHFASLEVAELRVLPPDQVPGRFLTIWTLKEAYLKARGVGLGVALDRFAFRLGARGPHVVFDPTIDDSPERWQFTSIVPAPTHVLAAAVALDGVKSVDLVVRPTVPCRSSAASG